mgnify:CR=1 FL=1
MFPLVHELADDSIPVAVTCRVLGFTKQGFYAWKKRGVSHRDWKDVNLIELIRQIHAEDPELGAERVWIELTLDRVVTVGLNRLERLMGGESNPLSDRAKDRLWQADGACRSRWPSQT